MAFDKDSKSVRVLQVNISSFGFGGMSNFIFKLGNEIQQYGITFDYLPSQNIKYLEYVGKIREQGGRVYDIDYGQYHSKVRRKIAFFQNLFFVLKKEKYSIVHINADQAYIALACSIIAKWKHTPHIIVHSHSTGLDGTKKSRLKLLAHRLCKPFLPLFATRFFACSPKAAQWMLPFFVFKQANYKIIKNGIQMEQFLFDLAQRDALRIQLNLQDCFVIGHIGRFTIQKNHLFLLKIFESVLRKDAQARLVLIGEGPLREMVCEEAVKRNLFDKIIFIENTSHVGIYMQAMDVFVLPSIFEGLGIVAIESQTSGLPTIISNEVPDDVMISPYCKKEPFQALPSYWAKEILEFKDIQLNRAQGSSHVRQAGYDLTQVAQELSNIYHNLKFETNQMREGMIEHC